MTLKGYIEPKKLEQAVRKHLLELGVTKNDYPINPYDLIRNEGIILQECGFDDDNIRGMIVHGDNATGIIINSNRSFVSRRFIAMHELSHYWYHPHETRRICLENYSAIRKGVEWQANNAAAYALMPKEVVISLFEDSNGDIDYMCDYLKVSKDCMTYRIKELSLTKAIYEDPRNVYRDIRNTYRPIYERDAEFESIENNWLYSWL